MSLCVSAAAVPDPAGDDASGAGHHPAHVHPVHQPELGQPGHAGDRGLSRELSPNPTPSTSASPSWAEEQPESEPEQALPPPPRSAGPGDIHNIHNIHTISSRLCQECNIFLFSQANLCVSSCFSKPIPRDLEHLVEQMWEMFFISRKILRVLLLSEFYSCCSVCILVFFFSRFGPPISVGFREFFLGGWGECVWFRFIPSCLLFFWSICCMQGIGGGGIKVKFKKNQHSLYYYDCIF